MKKYAAYLIDLDGTMYRGSEKIEEAVDFANELVEKNIPHLYVTNNSTKTPQEVAEHLQSFGIQATKDHVLTTAMATAQYIYERQPNASVYAIGESGLKKALTDKGLTLTEENPDIVIVGLDREVTYEKLTIACLAVRQGALFISTNGDIALPTERGMQPGNGSITSVVTVSTQTEPIFIGKPETVMMEQALELLQVTKEQALMIGDNYDTDILAGIRSDVDTLFVHTGVTTVEDLKTKKIQPTYSLPTLADWTFL